MWGSVLNRGDLGYVVGIGLIGNLDDLGHIVVKFCLSELYRFFET